MLECETCKHYEMYPKFKNPNMSIHHYCHKCKDEIFYKKGMAIIPKACYYNDFYEISQEAQEEKDSRYIFYSDSFADQVD